METDYNVIFVKNSILEDYNSEANCIHCQSEDFLYPCDGMKECLQCGSIAYMHGLAGTVHNYLAEMPYSWRISLDGKDECNAHLDCYLGAKPEGFIL